MKLIKRICLLLVLIAGSYGGYQGYKYYVRCTYLPVRYPFISNNGFRYLAKHHFDQPERLRISLTGQSFDPANVKDGDIIFIKNGPWYLDRFFKNIHPRINARYVLLSHGGDDAVPGAYEQYLADEKLIAWSGCNVEKPELAKMIPLPIGQFGILQKRLPLICREIIGKILVDLRLGRIKKTNFFYNNLAIHTNHAERTKAVQQFKDQPFCFNANCKPYEAYLREMATFKFVLSPHGAGYDCYRTWEALTLGCIPVVKKSCLDILYTGLPVVIVDDWADATEEFLKTKYNEMSRTTYQLERLSLDYWIEKIKQRVKELSASS